MITFIFGDSITFGLWDSKGGWADRLKQFVHAYEMHNNLTNYNEIYNLGVDGNTTQQVIDRFDQEVKTRLWEGETYCFIFAIGINDTAHFNYANLISSPEKYQEQLTTLYQQAKKYSSNICFIDLTPVDEALTNPLKVSTTGKCYTNDRIEAFNQTLHSFCHETNSDLVKVNNAFKQSDYKKLLIDGLHPNDAGHELMYNQALPIVNKYLNI